MRNRFIQVQFYESRQRKMMPFPVNLPPVQRRFPVIIPDGCKAFIEPPFGLPVSARFDKTDILSVGYKPVGKLNVVDIGFVARKFIVVPKTIAPMTDFINPFFK